MAEISAARRNLSTNKDIHPLLVVKVWQPERRERGGPLIVEPLGLGI